MYCHAEHAVAKFWGVCNEQKWALDACLREEKAINRCVCYCFPCTLCWWCGRATPAPASSQLLRSSVSTGAINLLVVQLCCQNLAKQQGRASPASFTCPHSLRVCLQQALPCPARRAKNFAKAKRERERLRQKLDAAQAPREGAAEPETARSTASEPQPKPNIAQALQASAVPSEAA